MNKLEQSIIDSFSQNFHYAFEKPIKGALELTHNNVKDFLASALKRQRQQIREEIEGKRKSLTKTYAAASGMKNDLAKENVIARVFGRNKVIDEILELDSLITNENE